jgi:hypothetical protein
MDDNDKFCMTGIMLKLATVVGLVITDSMVVSVGEAGAGKSGME